MVNGFSVILCMKCSNLSILEGNLLFCCERCAGETYKTLKHFNDLSEAEVYKEYMKGLHFNGKQ